MAREFLEGAAFSIQRHYDLERVGRTSSIKNLTCTPHPISKPHDIQVGYHWAGAPDIMINNGLRHRMISTILATGVLKPWGIDFRISCASACAGWSGSLKNVLSIRDQDQLSPITLINIPPGCRGFAGVLRFQPTISIHGSDKSTGRTAS